MDSSELSGNRAEEMRDIKSFPLAKIAFDLSIALIGSALAIGFYTYQHSFEMMQKGYQQLYLNKAQMIIKLAETEQAGSENEILDSIFQSWAINGPRPAEPAAGMVANTQPQQRGLKMDYTQMTAPCGLDCFNCPMFRANENQELKSAISKKLNMPIEKIGCKGCKG